VGCAQSTIYTTLLADKAFSEHYARAREVQLQRWEDELLEIADDGSNDFMKRKGKDGAEIKVADTEHINRSRLRADTRKWIMAKRNPKKYGERQQVDMAVKHDFSDMSDEELRRSLAEDLARLGITAAELGGPGPTEH
jgi:hypothetical protein